MTNKYWSTKIRETSLLIVRIFVFSVVIAAPLLQSVGATGLSDAQKKLFQENINYFDTCASDTPQTTDTTPKQKGTVYILGDSITAKAETDYKKAFKQVGVTATTDASSGRSLVAKGTDGNKLSGLDAIKHDKDNIAKTDGIVVALGTNGSSNTANIDKAIDALRAINTEAPIYWVDTISVGRSDNYNKTVIGPANIAIYGESRAKNYQVIPWFNAVSEHGDSQDPTKTEADPNGYIDNSDGLGVHPTTKGINTLVNLVTGVAGTAIVDPNADVAVTTDSSGQTVCCPTNASDASVALKGGSKEAKVYNFFISKGLTPEQTVGIMGNMEHESGFEPEAVEGGGHSSDPNSSGGGGWGIVQWTRGSKVLLIAKAAHIKSPINELGTQLEVLWAQLIGKAGSFSEKQAGDDLKAANGVEDAVRAFQGDDKIGGKYHGFERPLDESGSLQGRIASARSYLTKYSSQTDTGTASGDSGSSNVCCPPSASAADASTVPDGSPSDWQKMYTGTNKAKVDTMARGKISPKILVIHFTVGEQEGQDLLNFFATGAGQPDGIQFNVGKTGQVYQYYPLNDMQRTNHVGNANSKAIGIEITGHDTRALLADDAQFKSVVSLSKFLCDKYSIPCSEPKGDITGDGLSTAQGMLGHDETPTNDHTDPDSDVDVTGNISYNHNTHKVWTGADRKDSSQHPYMMKLRTAMGFNPTPGNTGTGSGDTGSSDSTSGSQCAASPSGNGTTKDVVGDGPNKSLALEAVQYDTVANNNKYTYQMGGLHGSLDQLKKFASDGGVADCSGFVRYVIWRVYQHDVGSFVTQSLPSMSDFVEVSANDVAAGDIAWKTEHVDFITDNKGGGKLHDFGAHSEATNLHGGDVNATEYQKFYRYVGPGSPAGGN